MTENYILELKFECIFSMMSNTGKKTLKNDVLVSLSLELFSTSFSLISFIILRDTFFM